MLLLVDVLCILKFYVLNLYWDYYDKCWHLSVETLIIQESPPAWTQEAYRPQEEARCWPPPTGWTWPPPQLDLTPPAGPDPPDWIDLWPWSPQLDWPLTLTPPAGLTFDLTPPAGLTFDLTPLAGLTFDLTPLAGLTFDLTPPAGLTFDPDPPRCGQTENITFPILRMRAVISATTKAIRICRF